MITGNGFITNVAFLSFLFIFFFSPHHLLLVCPINLTATVVFLFDTERSSLVFCCWLHYGIFPFKVQRIHFRQDTDRDSFALLPASDFQCSIMAFLHSSYFAWYPLLMWFQSIKFCLLINLLVRVVAWIYLSTKCTCTYSLVITGLHVSIYTYFVFGSISDCIWFVFIFCCWRILWPKFIVCLVCTNQVKNFDQMHLRKKPPWLNTYVVVSISVFFFSFFHQQTTKTIK